MAKELAAAPVAVPRFDAGRSRMLVLRTLSVAALLAIWTLVASLSWDIAIPSPLDVLKAFAKLDHRAFLENIALSFYRVVAGFLIAAAVGIPLGIWVGYSQAARNLVFPLVEVLRPVPPIAWIPLAILFFPKVEAMIIFLTFLGAFFPITYNTIAGFVSIKSMYIRAGKSLGANEWRLFWHVILPAMLPVVFAGLHVAIGISWLMVVAGEMMASKGGIGAMTWEAYQTSRYPLIFVGMTTIGLLGFASSTLIRLAGNLIVKWEAH